MISQIYDLGFNLKIGKNSNMVCMLQRFFTNKGLLSGVVLTFSILLLSPINDAWGRWRVGDGLVLHNAAWVGIGNARFGVECSGRDGRYAVAFVYYKKNIQFEGYFHFEVRGGRDKEIFYLDHGDVESVYGLLGVTIFRTSEQVFSDPENHPWIEALRAGSELKIYEDDQLRNTFDLVGSRKAINEVFGLCGLK